MVDDADEAYAELEALTAIMGDDMVVERDVAAGSASPRRFALLVAPECGDSGQLVGSVVLDVCQPPGYPRAAPAQVTVAGTASAGHAFEQHFNGEPFALSAEHADALRALVASIASQRAGEPTCLEITEAVRGWLLDHTVAPRPKAHAAADEEDELALDDSDMDEEMIDALHDVVPSSDALAPKLRAAEAMPAGSAEQRAALREIWRSLSDAQRREMVASDSDESDDDGEEDGGGGGPDAVGRRAGVRDPSAPRGSAGAGADAGRAKGRALPPPARRACPKGHALTAVSSKPDDYRRLRGDEGNCDMCDADFFYAHGAYHCATCRDWDCCVRCGSGTAAVAPSRQKPAVRGRGKGGGTGKNR